MYRMISFVVDEKASRAREGMKIMGLRDTPYWLSWFLYYFIIATVISLFSAAILKINIFVHTSYLILFLFLWLYGLSLFSLAILITCFIERPRTAGIIATLIHFLSYFFGGLVTQPIVTRQYKTLGSIFPNIAMSLLSDVLVTLENRSVGASTSNLTEVVNNYTVWTAFAAFLLDFVILFIIALYLDNFLPK